MRGVLKTVSGQLTCIKCQKPGAKPLPEAIKRKLVTITLAPFWHQTGKKLAQQRGISFSRYIEELIYPDSMRMESAE
ncbi:MAG: hypothetical protein DWQ04_22945 [Chloroflexi bacterium]|nr:MAG: hypothetical protein DWQ04_22945 [Chloroflexota bacterium]